MAHQERRNPRTTKRYSVTVSIATTHAWIRTSSWRIVSQDRRMPERAHPIVVLGLSGTEMPCLFRDSDSLLSQETLLWPWPWSLTLALVVDVGFDFERIEYFHLPKLKSSFSLVNTLPIQKGHLTLLAANDTQFFTVCRCRQRDWKWCTFKVILSMAMAMAFIHGVEDDFPNTVEEFNNFTTRTHRYYPRYRPHNESIAY